MHDNCIFDILVKVHPSPNSRYNYFVIAFVKKRVSMKEND